jgi:hypothetical protein
LHAESRSNIYQYPRPADPLWPDLARTCGLGEGQVTRFYSLKAIALVVDCVCFVIEYVCVVSFCFVLLLLLISIDFMLACVVASLLFCEPVLSVAN